MQASTMGSWSTRFSTSSRFSFPQIILLLLGIFRSSESVSFFLFQLYMRRNSICQDSRCRCSLRRRHSKRLFLGRDHSWSIARFQESSAPRLELLFPIFLKVLSVTAQRPNLLPRLILLPGALGIPLIYTHLTRFPRNCAQQD